jgi:hypothetical protein
MSITTFKSDYVGHVRQPFAGASQGSEVAFAVFDPSAVGLVVKPLLNSLID